MVQAGDGGRSSDRLLSIFSTASPETIDRAIVSIADNFIDDAILNVAFEIHRKHKLGLLALEDGFEDDEDQYQQVTTEGLDVFGNAPAKKQQECVCPNCSRNLAAARFAPHLEKCMGMGRNSSRIASRRIQNNSSSNHGGVGCASDEDDDEDWVMDRKRRRRDKNSPRRSRNSKMKTEPSSSGSSSNVTNNNFEMILSSGTVEEKKVVLSQICGVTSEHTRKICLRSVRCPQHSGEQRRAVRDQYLLSCDDSLSSLGSSTTRGVDSTSGNGGRSSLQDVDEVQVDIDGLDEANLGSSWDHDLSNTTSPADSTSTNNSTSSINRRSNNKSRKKSSKSSKSSNSSHSSALD